MTTRNRWIRRVALFVPATAVGAVLVAATSSSAAIEWGGVWNGTSWTLQSVERSALSRVGVVRDYGIWTLRFTSETTFSATDDENRTSTGTYTTRGRRATKVVALIDDQSKTAFNAYLGGVVNEAVNAKFDLNIDDAVVESRPASRIMKAVGKLNLRNGVLTIKLRYPVRASSEELGRRANGSYALTLRGVQDD